LYELQSQLSEEDNVTEDGDTTNTTSSQTSSKETATLTPNQHEPSLVTAPKSLQHTSSTSSPYDLVLSGSQWGYGTAHYRELDRLLRLNYGHSTFLYDLLEQQQDASGIRTRWNILREEDSDRHPARLALFRLLRGAGISSQDCNPVQQGQLMVAGFLVRLAYLLICQSGRSNDLQFVKDTLEDGHKMLDVSKELMSIENDVRRFIVEHRMDLELD
jgi:hypothetical protein